MCGGHFGPCATATPPAPAGHSRRRSGQQAILEGDLLGEFARREPSEFCHVALRLGLALPHLHQIVKVQSGRATFAICVGEGQKKINPLHLQAGLLRHLPGQRFFGGLPGFHEPTGNVPPTAERLLGSPAQQHTPIPNHERPHTRSRIVVENPMAGGADSAGRLTGRGRLPFQSHSTPQAEARQPLQPSGPLPHRHARQVLALGPRGRQPRPPSQRTPPSGSQAVGWPSSSGFGLCMM